MRNSTIRPTSHWRAQPDRVGSFNDDFGVDIGYQQVGYLFPVRDEDVDSYQASIELQRSSASTAG